MNIELLNKYEVTEWIKNYWIDIKLMNKKRILE